LVTGGYGHPRLRAMLVAGVIGYILKHAAAPAHSCAGLAICYRR
jgi:hypothetical protein